MPAPSPAAQPPQAASQWFVHPAVDLLVGCGLWSAPLMLLTTHLKDSNAGALAFAFYVITFFCNYPHYMATIYRAYGTREDFNKYKYFTVHLTVVMLLTAAITHASHTLFGGGVNLVPYFVTFYLTWSPYHYMGQNFGLTMMFARRNGASPSPLVRNALRASYVASYALLFIAIHSGDKGEPNTFSLGIPRHVAEPVRYLALGTFFLVGIPAMLAMVRQAGLRRMTGAIALFLTQSTWFAVPAIYEMFLGQSPPAVYYSTGILAFMHCAQYLWITGYYTKRETEAGLRGDGRWRPLAYYATLIVGGIALFVPGPWIVSRAFKYDLTESVLIFASLVNIHHFMLDGAIWKLRDGKVAALLLGQRDKSGAFPAGGVTDYLTGFGRWLTGATVVARSIRYTGIAALLGIAGVDITYNFLTRQDASLQQLALGQRLNPYDTASYFRRANILADQGDLESAMEEARRGIAINKYSATVQRLLPLLLAQEGMRLRDQRLLTEARAGFAYLPMLFRPDFSTLVNWGLVASMLGDEEEAMEKLRAAVEMDPNEPEGHLHLADAYMKRREFEKAADHYDTYLTLSQVTNHSAIPQGMDRQISTAMKMADALAGMKRPQEALLWFKRVADMTAEMKDFDTASQACLRAAQVQEDSGFLEAAAGLHREGIRLAGESGYEEPQGRAWMLYALFMRRRLAPGDMALAAILHAEDLLRGSLSPLAEEAASFRAQFEQGLDAETLERVRADRTSLATESLQWVPQRQTARTR